MRTILSLPNCVRATSILLTLFLISFNSPIIGQGQAPELPAKTFIVVIDPGHGGKDPGAVGKISKEKDIALSIAKKTGDYISSLMPDVKVLYTRTTDKYIDLSVRAKIATDNKADLFMSIHVNANNKSSIYGAETYVMGPSKSERNLALAIKENSVISFEEGHETTYDFDPEDPASYIMFSTVQNSFLNQSLLMASQVQDQLRKNAKRKDGGVRQAPFLVLWRTARPSVLIETGYISNSTEEKYLNTEDGQDVIASAIYQAFRNYKTETEAKSTKTTENTENIDSSSSEKIKIDASSKSDEQTQVTVVSNEQGNTKKTESPKKEDKKEVKANEFGGLLFRVQIIASKKKIPKGSKHFKNVTNLEEILVGEYYKYMTVPVKTYAQSQKIMKELSDKFPGAFVVAFLDGKKIPLKEGISMDKLNN